MRCSRWGCLYRLPSLHTRVFPRRIRRRLHLVGLDCFSFSPTFRRRIVVTSCIILCICVRAHKFIPLQRGDLLEHMGGSAIRRESELHSMVHIASRSLLRVFLKRSSAGVGSHGADECTSSSLWKLRRSCAMVFFHLSCFPRLISHTRLRLSPTSCRPWRMHPPSSSHRRCTLSCYRTNTLSLLRWSHCCGSSSCGCSLVICRSEVIRTSRPAIALRCGESQPFQFALHELSPALTSRSRDEEREVERVLTYIL